MKSVLLLVLGVAVVFGVVNQATGQGESGIEGTISIGPTHPGPIRPGMRPSKPFNGGEFNVLKGEDVVTSFTTDGEGKFRVGLPPGHYTVARKGGKGRIGFFGPFQVDVAPGQMAKVSWHCDSGMR